MSEKVAQCIKCSHYMVNSSCGPCVDVGAKLVESAVEGTEIVEDKEKSEEDLIFSYKSTCKVVVKNPEDFNEVNPFDCRFYFPAAYKMF